VPTPQAMMPFELAIADSQLDDLRRRLERARWPAELLLPDQRVGTLGHPPVMNGAFVVGDLRIAAVAHETWSSPRSLLPPTA
jgi:hypothetical protein